MNWLPRLLQAQDRRRRTFLLVHILHQQVLQNMTLATRHHYENQVEVLEEVEVTAVSVVTRKFF
jgi:hypothetical protein